MIDVYLRDENSVAAMQIGRVKNAVELRDLLDLLRDCGVYSNGDVSRQIIPQFVLDNEDAYVEFFITSGD